jgi:hypothetical protein
MPDENLVKHTKSFKKYKAEYRPEVVDAARAYALGRSDFSIYEDRSLLKLTSTKDQIEAMLTTLRSRFGPLAGDETPAEAKKEKADAK